MDTLSIVIIVISVVLAVLFKWVLFRKIGRWMDVDLIKQLSKGEAALEQRLTEHYHSLKSRGIKRREIHNQLQQLADQHEPER